jgi:hypothetical protein
VGARAFPRHARRPGAGGWAGRMAPVRSLGPQVDRHPPRPPARRDPLVHPVAITEHCVIGDQIRVPAAWCDMAGCVARFADPAALGEADNRARALVAGWGEDGLGRLVCPACQQRHRQSAAREMIVPEPKAAPARGPAGPAGAARPSPPHPPRAAGRGEPISAVNAGQVAPRREPWPTVRDAMVACARRTGIRQ